MRIYDATTVHEIAWPDTDMAALARRFVVPLITQGVSAYCSERAEIQIAIVDEHVVPLAITAANSHNSPNCSMLGRYVDIPGQAIPHMKISPALRRMMSGGLRGLGLMLRYGGIERCVYVGSWLVFRGLEPRLTPAQARRLTAALTARFPQHALVFPAVNPLTHAALLNSLASAGYSFLSSSHTRILTPDLSALTRSQRKAQRYEIGLIARHRYQVVDASALDASAAARIAALYEALNRIKHAVNPSVTPALFAMAIEGDWLNVRAIVRDGRIDAFYAYPALGALLSPALAGYDLQSPDAKVLYRILMAAIFREARQRGMYVETGGGADEFKRMRGDRPIPRYGAFFVDHLPAPRRAAWQLLQRYANRVFVGSLRQYLRTIDGDAADCLVPPPRVFEPPFEPPQELAAEAAPSTAPTRGSPPSQRG